VENKEAILACAYKAIGRPYLFGAKWALADKDPQGPIDCSGFVRWCYWQGGLTIGDGTYHQHLSTEPCDDPRPTDLGFFLRDGLPYHVGMLYDNESVVEARGDKFNAVIMRPRAKWEAWKGFSGWRRM